MEIRKRLKARLPATPCTLEMREAFDNLAKQNECDLAELQRAAFSLFLKVSETKSFENGTHSSKQEQAS